MVVRGKQVEYRMRFHLEPVLVPPRSVAAKICIGNRDRHRGLDASRLDSRWEKDIQPGNQDAGAKPGEPELIRNPSELIPGAVIGGGAAPPVGPAPR